MRWVASIPGLHKDEAAAHTAPTDAPEGTVEQVYATNEGPVVITTRGRLVFVAESFDLDQARKLTTLILDTQGTGDLKMARAVNPRGITSPAAGPTLSAGLVEARARLGIAIGGFLSSKSTGLRFLYV